MAIDYRARLLEVLQAAGGQALSFHKLAQVVFESDVVALDATQAMEEELRELILQQRVRCVLGLPENSYQYVVPPLQDQIVAILAGAPWCGYCAREIIDRVPGQRAAVVIEKLAALCAQGEIQKGDHPTYGASIAVYSLPNSVPHMKQRILHLLATHPDDEYSLAAIRAALGNSTDGTTVGQALASLQHAGCVFTRIKDDALVYQHKKKKPPAVSPPTGTKSNTDLILEFLAKAPTAYFSADYIYRQVFSARSASQPVVGLIAELADRGVIVRGSSDGVAVYRHKAEPPGLELEDHLEAAILAMFVNPGDVTTHGDIMETFRVEGDAAIDRLMAAGRLKVGQMVVTGYKFELPSRK